MKPNKINEEPLLNTGDLDLAPRETVAATLRRHRKQSGQDLKTVAEALRIRYVYLEAIEQGRYDALPGPTYALGFIKTYADYLHLNEKDIVDRFREDVHGLEGQTQLVFPTPVPEGKVPGGAILLVAVLMGSIAYGGWHYLSNKETGFTDFIPALPDRLQALFEGALPDSSVSQPTATSGGGSQAPASQSAETASSTSVPSAAETPSQGSQGSETADTAASNAQSTATTSSETAVSGTAAAVNPATTQTSAAATGNQTPTLQTPSLQAPVVQSPAVATPSVQVPATTEIPAAPAAPATTQTVSVPDATQPQIYGEDNADARIILRATQDSWVQVRDSANELLLTRVLREGDVYRVPNQKGLTLLTGNAGGIDVLVDGALMAPLGPVGSVRRDLALDPQGLLTGAAAQ